MDPPFVFCDHKDKQEGRRLGDGNEERSVSVVSGFSRTVIRTVAICRPAYCSVNDIALKSIVTSLA